jgi:cholesterol oxidase
MAGGITFRETMDGWFALGATTPEAGAEQGRQQGTRLSMHAEVTVDDLDRFVTVREHDGKLTGSIDFQPLGFGLAARSGLFQLFSPGPEEGRRRMVYELAFAADGKPWYLAGEKRVGNDSGLDLWKDTTTLYTTLHRGGDRTGPVAGAGMLTLGVRQLLDLMATLRPIQGGDLGTIVTFGRFFFGELWDVYAPHLGGSARSS